jgi:hypothetical protein
MKTAAAALALLLTGCAATARDNAENVCNFTFVTVWKVKPVVAALCTFGLEPLIEKYEDSKEEKEPELNV